MGSAQPARENGTVVPRDCFPRAAAPKWSRNLLLWRCEREKQVSRLCRIIRICGWSCYARN